MSGELMSFEDRVVMRAEALVKKLNEVDEDPVYQSVWENAKILSGPYSGPNYRWELAELEAALKANRERIVLPETDHQSHLGTDDEEVDPKCRWGDTKFADQLGLAAIIMATLGGFALLLFIIAKHK